MWFVMLTTFRENFREGWTVRWSKRGKIFCYFSLTTTFLFILIFFGFLNCIYQAFTTDFYLLSFSLTTLYQLLKLHLVVRCQNHGLMNLWIIIETVKLLIVRITFETKWKNPRWAQLYYTAFLNETKQKIEQELQEIGVEESKKQDFLLAAASSNIFRVTKGCGLETCGELTGHQNLSSSNFHTRCYFRLQLPQAYPSHVV